MRPRQRKSVEVCDDIAEAPGSRTHSPTRDYLRRSSLVSRSGPQDGYDRGGDRLAGDPRPATKPGVCHYLVAIAKLGGYLARAKDPPPGNMVIWRGLTRLMDIWLGSELSKRIVGN
jgi:hypothetical protein